MSDYSISYNEALSTLNRKNIKPKVSLLEPSWELFNDKWEIFIARHYHNIPFALTGSRFFQYLNKSCDSDWDFFTPYSEDTESYLKSLDTRIEVLYLNASDYKDTDVVKVYRYSNPLALNGITQIDIQLVKDYNRRLVIRDVLKNMYLPWEHLHKNTRSNLWNGMYILSALPGIE